jgi:type II secretory pathway pseudopilin PulG
MRGFGNGGLLRAALTVRRRALHDDGGLSLVELVVAIAIVLIVLLGGFEGIDSIQLLSSQQRNVIEAGNLATQYEELFQAAAYAEGGNISPGTYTYHDLVGGTRFTTDVAFSIQDPSGTSTAPVTLCTSGSASETGEIWGITATVTWRNMGGIPPVVQTTDLAPGKAGVLSLDKATVAVELVGPDDAPVTSSINFTISEVAAVANPDPAPALPGGKTSYSTSSGCAVVDNLIADPDWYYVITLSGNSGWVSSQELSDLTPTQPGSGDLSVSAGEVTKVNNPLQIAEGQTESVTLQPVTYTCGAQVTRSCYSSAFSPAAGIPVSVGNPSLSGGEHAFSGTGGATPTSLLLFPYSNGYGVWSGDQAQSSPSWASYTGSEQQQSPSISVAPGGSGSVTVPVYELALTTSASGPITAVEQGGAGTSYALAPGGSKLYTAGLPLGQYELEANGVALSPDPYVWLTPSGWIAETASAATPSGTPQTGTLAES